MTKHKSRLEKLREAEGAIAPLEDYVKGQKVPQEDKELGRAKPAKDTQAPLQPPVEQKKPLPSMVLVSQIIAGRMTGFDGVHVQDSVMIKTIAAQRFQLLALEMADIQNVMGLYDKRWQEIANAINAQRAQETKNDV